MIFSRESYGKFEKYFPAREISVKTPAFQGDQIEFTTTDQMFKYIAGVAKENIQVDFFSIGKSPQGKLIPYLMITEKGAINIGYDPKKLTVWVQAMQHGDEPAAGEAALNIIGFLATEEGKKLLKNLNVIVVPRVNMDGAERGERFNNGVDMNRDHMKLTLPGARGIKKGVLKYNPEIFIDLHEYPASLTDFSKLPGKTILPFYDILTYKSVNMNTDSRITNLADEILGNLKRDLNNMRITTSYFYNGLKRPDENNIILDLPIAQSGAFRNAYGIHSGVSILIEGRGRGLGMENYSRRVENIADSVKSILRYAAARKKEIKSVIQDAKRSSEQGMDENIYLIGGESTNSSDYKFIKVDEGWVDDFRVTLHSTTDMSKAHKRIIPEGYLLSRRESRGRELLDLHGINYRIINKETPIKTEEYYKTSEGYQVRSGSGSALEGDIYVPTKQIQRKVVALLFEPDGLESFVTHGIVDEEDVSDSIKRIVHFPVEMR